MRLLAIMAFMALIIMPGVAAPDGLSLATTYHYQSHGIAFDIPENWSLVSDQWNNRTQIDGTLLTDAKMELTDNQSTIRIDVVECPQIAWFMDTFCKDSGYYKHDLGTFYQKAALGSTFRGSHGSSYNDYTLLINDNLKELILVKVVNDKQMIGVYGNFNGVYEFQVVSHTNFEMPQPLYDIANSLKPIQ